MRDYECMYILHPELQEDQYNQLVEKFQNLVADTGGAIVKTDIWGKRRLAYEVKKLREGYYVLFNFQGEPSTAQELERVLKITEGVIRYLVIRLKDDQAELAAAEEEEKKEEVKEEAAVPAEADKDGQEE
jgi:small subunit ribosomal protein S6